MSTTPTTPALTLAARILAVMKEVGGVAKRANEVNSRNASYTMNAISENDILEKVQPALIAHGVLVWPEFQQYEVVVGPPNLIIVTVHNIFEDVATGLTRIIPCAGMASLQDDKAVSKAVTDANKNLWKKLLQLHDPADSERARTAPRTTNSAPRAAQASTKTQAPPSDCVPLVGIVGRPAQPQGKTFYKVTVADKDGNAHDLSFFAKGTLLTDVRRANDLKRPVTVLTQSKGKYHNLVGFAFDADFTADPETITNADTKGNK